MGSDISLNALGKSPCLIQEALNIVVGILEFPRCFLEPALSSPALAMLRMELFGLLWEV